MRKPIATIILLLTALMLSSCQPPSPGATFTPNITSTPHPTPTPEPTPVPVTRRGGWLDTITMISMSPDPAVAQMTQDGIDVYSGLLEGAADWNAIQAANLAADPVYNRFYEIALNPAPIDNEKKGRLNPFADAGIRGALNRLVDRDAVVSQFFAGQAAPKYSPLTAGLADSVRYAQELEALAGQYAYDPEACRQTISQRMQAMGAQQADGLWTYGDKPVTLVFLIQSDDEAGLGIGDMMSDALESMGFAVEREYLTTPELTDRWLGTDPSDGRWHLATVCWRLDEDGRDTAQLRDSGGDFALYMSADSVLSYFPLWRLYAADESLRSTFAALSRREFHTADERRALMADALHGAAALSYRIFIADAAAAVCRSPQVEMTPGLAQGVAVGAMTPFTLRLAGAEGGELTWGADGLFAGSVNPVAGTRDARTLAPVRFTQDYALMPDAQTGLMVAQRALATELAVRGDLPVEKAADSPWLTLVRTGEAIAVPSDAYVGWDGENGVWITAGQRDPDGLTALTRSVVTYDISGVRWHDGSPMTAADFMMAMIVRFDRADERSSLYDPSAVTEANAFKGLFKGFRIVSDEPLTIEYYSDAYAIDAEQCVAALWPEGAAGQAAWHVLAVCSLTEAEGETAFSSSRAQQTNAEWTNLLYGPSLPLLEEACERAAAERLIPYPAVMSDYITADEAAARYRSLLDFYTAHGHMWIGTGPYILDRVDAGAGSMTLVCNSDYVDLCNRWTDAQE
ncbi:MAG: ABC transporter substrate-binding protein [Christensenellales bacterium]